MLFDDLTRHLLWSRINTLAFHLPGVVSKRWLGVLCKHEHPVYFMATAASPTGSRCSSHSLEGQDKYALKVLTPHEAEYVPTEGDGYLWTRFSRPSRIVCGRRLG